MSEQFTPGPWHWKAELGRDEMPMLLGANGLPVCDFGNATTYYPIEGTPPEPEDARLIAAAAELYEGCNALLGLVQLLRNRPDLPTDLRLALEDDNHRIAEAEAVLAKAGTKAESENSVKTASENGSSAEDVG